MKRICALVLVVASAGCTNYDWGETETIATVVSAKIVQLSYVPPTHGNTSGSVGMTTAGDLAFTGGQSVSTPEVWAIVVKFVDGSVTVVNGKDAYQKAVVGAEVGVEYLETFRTYKDGRRILERQSIESVHFVDTKR